jgi:hypothetical protein
MPRKRGCRAPVACRAYSSVTSVQLVARLLAQLQSSILLLLQMKYDVVFVTKTLSAEGPCAIAE